MIRFSRKNVALLQPYMPGYQPNPGEKVIKLNTNENPYPPSPRVLEAIRNHISANLRLYPNPKSSALREKIAEVYRVAADQVFCGNGSDEIISLVFRAFVDRDEAVLFPYPTYSFYRTAAEIHDVRYRYVDTDRNFEVDLDQFLDYPAKVTFIANPNPPMGILLPRARLEPFIRRYPGVVVVDETYIDFAGEESVYELVKTCDNLLVLRTFSKSFSLCGIRVGYAFGDRGLVAELDKVKDSYNIGYLNQVAAISALEDYDYMVKNVREICANREWLKGELALLGFTVLPSAGNFLYVTHDRLTAESVYKQLADRQIYVRHFDDRRISNYLRITIGTREQLQELLRALIQITGSRSLGEYLNPRRVFHGDVESGKHEKV